VKIKNNNFTIRHVLNQSCEYLNNSGIESPETDAELILAEVVAISRNELYINYDRILTDEQLDRYNKLIRERSGGYPVDYVLGYSIFMGLKLEVNSNTLIPRPETELLVEKAIEFITRKRKPKAEANKKSGEAVTVRNKHHGLCSGVFIDNNSISKVLEIGSGSGNIAVSLAKFTGCHVVSIEKNKDTILVARKNAKNHNMEDKIEFICSDMFESLNLLHKKEFDLLVSNPPYIKFSEYDSLQSEVKKEPVGALVGGADGLVYIRQILKEGLQYVKSGGRIYLEIGYDQKEAVEEILLQSSLKNYSFIKDYCGIDRILEVSV
jgi:release factor glutamine methyltransferase